MICPLVLAKQEADAAARGLDRELLRLESSARIDFDCTDTNRDEQQNDG